MDATPPQDLVVGDRAKLVLRAEGGRPPITWEREVLPPGWTAESTKDGRTWTAHGPLPIGSADPGLPITVVAVAADGAHSKPEERRLRARPAELRATLRLEHDSPLVKGYSVVLQNVPEWPARSNGRIELWIDTEGLAPAGPQDDYIRIWDVAPTEFRLESRIKSDGLTKATKRENGETVTLNSEAARNALQDGRFSVSIRCYHGSEMRVVSVSGCAY